MSLEGKVAIVTGASRGIGWGIAVEMARAGADIVVASRTERESDPRLPGDIHKTAADVEALGRRALPIKTDVADEESVAAMVRATIDRFGRIDILVNNAALVVPGNLRTIKVRHFDLIWRVNMRGPFLCAKACAEEMVKVGGGHIINISSGGATSEGPGAYGPTKAALERWTVALAKELRDDNIGAIVLLPKGAIDTPGLRFLPTVPTEMRPPEDMGRAAVWIAEQAPLALTGQKFTDLEILEKLRGG
jgi:citronellol/citronellal dehydrogenase